MFIDGRILFYKQITGRYVSLWLVIIIVRDKILDRIVREEFLEFSIQLRGQSFIGCQDNGRALLAFQDVCNRECLARTRDPK